MDEWTYKEILAIRQDIEEIRGVLVTKFPDLVGQNPSIPVSTTQERVVREKE